MVMFLVVTFNASLNVDVLQVFDELSSSEDVDLHESREMPNLLGKEIRFMLTLERVLTTDTPISFVLILV